MNIAIDARKFLDFGIGTYLRNVLDQFAVMRAGHHFALLSRPEDLPALRGRYGDAFDLVEESSGKYSLAEHLSIPQKLRHLDVDLYLSPHYVVPLIKVKPTVTIIHDVIHLKFHRQIGRPGALAYARFMLRHAVRSSDRIVTISEWSRRDIHELLGVSSERIAVIPAAVDSEVARVTDVDRLAAVRQRCGIHGEYLLYAGAFKPHKNVGALLRAFAALDRTRCPALVLAGDRLERYPQMGALVSELKLTNAVINPGWLEREDFNALISGARVFVFPSLYEGFGMPPLEAMACGVPVAASNASCMPEILGPAPEYFDPNDTNDMARAVNALLVDDGLRAQRIEAGFRQVARYSWRRSAEQLLAVFEEAIG